MRLICLVAITGVFLASSASADSGVSDERVVLPDGPGSIGGVGENVEIDPNMGSMRYVVPINVPPGFKGATPSMSLNYSSTSGSSVLGIGWSIASPSIERATFRGLPIYDQTDLFAADGSNELVRVQDGTTPTYRARFESSFTRYRWHEPGDGSAGYWTAEYSDGRVGYFGADASGTTVPNARIENAAGEVFRYYLVETVDSFGHRVVYTYTKSGGTPLMTGIGYAFEGQEPRFSIRLGYEDRDDILSDAKPGFELQLDKRLSEIRIQSRAEVIRRYEMAYEDPAESGGFSRLVRVTQFGRNNVQHPIEFTFTYSKALGGTCVSDCEKPFMVDMGQLQGGIDIGTGRATLIDINGDSLPDVLATSMTGQHTFQISELSTDGRPTFGTNVVDSAMTPNSSPFILSNPGVQVLDVNGDGFTDIVASRNAQVYCNIGVGDWSGTSCLENSTLPILDADTPGDANPMHVRFFDYNNDKRIDMMRTTSTMATEVFVNTGTAFEVTDITPIGSVFDESTLQLTDINGDGLQDPVEILADGSLRFKINLGWGNWTEWRVINLPDFGSSALLQATLEDLNGDSLADIVVIAGTEIKYALNRNGERFDDIVTVTSAEIDGDLPERLSTTNVSFADMNGNGTRDPVWITSNGSVKFLELFPVKPNLLSSISNGLGWYQEISYGTSVAELARDAQLGRPWTHKLSHAMTVVVQTDTWVTLTGADGGEGLHEVVEFEYHDGFYDGVEKQFRGYASVERRLISDMSLDSQDPAITYFDYDVGASDPYYNGKLLSQRILTGEDLMTPLNEEHVEYDDCPVAGIVNTNLTREVRYICETGRERVLQEGAAESAWATTRTEQDYDGYGNVTASRSLGVIHMGPPDDPMACGACVGSGFGEPCGAQCEGDEEYTETEYVTPGADTGGAWQLGLAYREVKYGEVGGDQKETLTYYDGEDYEGLAAGLITRGVVSRIMDRVGESMDDFVASERYAYDDDGNVVGSLDPLGAADDDTGHRRTYQYSENGLSMVRVEILLSDAVGDYRLRRDIAFEEAFKQPSEATTWMVVRDGEVQTARNSTKFRYDEHGRVNKKIRPGDDDDAPTEAYIYELGDPTTRIVIQKRSLVGGDVDLEEVRCLDGKGREYQVRHLIADGSYHVTGFKEFNSRGKPVREYESYSATTGDCEMDPPTGVRFTSTRYDGVGRDVLTTFADEEIYGSASTQRKVYEPLGVVTYDQVDTDSGSEFVDTPTRVRNDGLGRTIAVERFLEASGSAVGVTIEYDGLGRIAAYVDANGNRHGQTYDLLGRVLSVDDPNSGVETFEYDAAGNVLVHGRADGQTSVTEYEGTNRPVRHWDQDMRDTTLVEYIYDEVQDCDRCSNVAGQLGEVSYPLRATDLDSLGIDRAGYDGRGQMIYSSRELEGHEFATETEYDNAGRVARKVYPDGQTQEWKYDGMSRPVAIPGTIDAFEYDERGLLSKLSYANGAQRETDFDALQRITAIRNTMAGDVLQGRSYKRDRMSNILTTDDTSTEREGAIDLMASYNYDAWYRVVEATVDGAADEPEVLSFSFDKIDNISSMTSSREDSVAHVGDFEYDPGQPGAVVKAGSLEMSYDRSGRMGMRGDVTYAWDHLDRLVSATRDDEVIAEFIYGPDHKRVMKLEGGGVVYYVEPDFEVRDGIGVLYPRAEKRRVSRQQTDGLRADLLTDLNADEEITAADAWLSHAAAEEIADVELDGNASAPGRLLRASARRLLFAAGPQKAYIHHDHLGSSTMATDEDGNVLGERDYYPTGIARSEQGFVDTYGFTGQELDESTGLVHFEYRYLDTHTGRWVSPDPAFGMPSIEELAEKRESTTRYTYVGNNFINAVDPTGLKGENATKKKKGKKKAKKKGKKKGKKKAKKGEKGKKTAAKKSGATEKVKKTGAKKASEKETKSDDSKSSKEKASSKSDDKSDEKKPPTKLEKTLTNVENGAKLAGVIATIAALLVDDEDTAAQLKVIATVAGATSTLAGLANKSRGKLADRKAKKAAAKSQAPPSKSK